MAAAPLPTDRGCSGTVALLAEAIEAKDPLLRGHSEEVSGHVGAVGEQLGMSEECRDRLLLGAPIPAPNVEGGGPRRARALRGHAVRPRGGRGLLRRARPAGWRVATNRLRR